MFKKRKYVSTADGSPSIYLEGLNEQYHSKHGAIAESEHIFIKNGLLAKRELSKIDVFEVGMGTGLNVLMSLKASLAKQLTINYCTVEAYPIKEEELMYIDYSTLLQVEENIFTKIHTATWGKEIKLASNFKLIKHLSRLEEKKLDAAVFDVIYFDAFAPEKQPEMWEKKVFEDLYSALRDKGILVTYCVKGEIRRRLQEVGFVVEKLPGPPNGKREMCRAWKGEA